MPLKKPTSDHTPPSLFKIAQQAGVSRTTASLVLNGHGGRYRIAPATCKRVRATAVEIGYTPNAVARQLTGKPSHAVGMLINTSTSADPRLIQRIETLAAPRGLRFIIGHAVGEQRQVINYMKDFQARRLDAMISIFHNHPSVSGWVLSELERFEKVVYFEAPADPTVARKACFVEPNFDEVGRLGVTHLLERGCRRIALVLNDLDFPYAIRRMKAYIRALKKAASSRVKRWSGLEIDEYPTATPWDSRMKTRR